MTGPRTPSAIETEYPDALGSKRDHILTPVEVAAELRCSKAHVYNLINGNVVGMTVLPHLALGRKKIIPRSEFEMWKRQNLTGRIVTDSESNTVDAGA